MKGEGDGVETIVDKVEVGGNGQKSTHLPGILEPGEDWGWGVGRLGLSGARISGFSQA